MAHFNKGRADGNSLIAVEEDHTSFSLGGGCHDGVDGLVIGEYWAIWSGSRPDGGRMWSVAQIVTARSTNACFELNNICCVTVNVETHVTSVKTDDGVWLSGSVVHQHFRIFMVSVVGEAYLEPILLSKTSMVGLTARDIEEGSYDDVHPCDASFLKFRCGCGFGRLLDFGTICRFKPFVWIILGEFGDGVLEALRGFANRVRHGDVDVVFWVVPIDSQSAVLSARCVDGDGVIFLEGIDEVSGVGGDEEFDAKVVYSKGEGGGKGRMSPKARIIFHRGVTMELEVAY